MTRRGAQWIVARSIGTGFGHLEGRRNPLVAAEGIPFLVVAAVCCFAVYRWMEPGWLLPALALTGGLAVVFRDPRRSIPAVPLGVVSPVDGRVLDTGRIEGGRFEGAGLRVLIRIDVVGAYTARSPVEGKVMDLAADGDGDPVDYPANALWMQTDEHDDVVLHFRGYRLGLPPKSLVRYGERVGQGARCAYLRLARLAEVHLPEGSRLLVSPGDRVIGGRDVIARLPNP